MAGWHSLQHTFATALCCDAPSPSSEIICWMTILSEVFARSTDSKLLASHCRTSSADTMLICWSWSKAALLKCSLSLNCFLQGLGAKVDLVMIPTQLR